MRYLTTGASASIPARERMTTRRSRHHGYNQPLQQLHTNGMTCGRTSEASNHGIAERFHYNPNYNGNSDSRQTLATHGGRDGTTKFSCPLPPPGAQGAPTRCVPKIFGGTVGALETKNFRAAHREEGKKRTQPLTQRESRAVRSNLESLPCRALEVDQDAGPRPAAFRGGSYPAGRAPTR